MKTVLILLIAVLKLSISGYCQDTAQLKRAAYHLNVAVDEKSSYEEDLNETPYIYPDNTVQLYPGEAVNIEINQQNGVIENMKAVKEITDSARTITISFTQSVKKNVQELMMLKVTNPFSKDLIYKATIFLLDKKKWIDTDVYPVYAGLSAFETWPNVIISIGLGSWAFKSN
jgi:hypothetical protein